MAFCPNCGTPNTDQTEKCVSCGFELIVPKQKAKFKGTIMMSGIKAPASGEQPIPPGATTLNNGSSTPNASPAESPAAPRPTGTPAAAPASPAGRNLSHQKTMMGHASVLLPTQPGAPAAPTPATPAASSTHAPGPNTRETPAAKAEPTAPIATPPSYDARAASHERDGSLSGPAHASSNELAATSATGSHRGAPPSASYGGTPSSSSSSRGGARYPTQAGAGYESTLPPAAPAKPNPGKVLAIGCAVALSLLVLAGLLAYYVLRPKLQAMFADDDGSAEAAAWQASISQSLAQVSGLCQVDCSQAGVFFHPRTQAELLGEARALTPERLQKLGDPTLSHATMLAGTGDDELATKLGLDPQQCARVTAGQAKVISCSVPDVDGKPSVLRIVHLSGVSSL